MVIYLEPRRTKTSPKEHLTIQLILTKNQRPQPPLYSKFGFFQSNLKKRVDMPKVLPVSNKNDITNAIKGPETYQDQGQRIASNMLFNQLRFWKGYTFTYFKTALTCQNNIILQQCF